MTRPGSMPETGAPSGRSTPATLLALGWTLLLASLATLWVWSPFLGEGTSFIAWSPPAMALTLWTVRWLRARRIEEVPSSRLVWITVGAGWMLALLAASTDLGRRLALDGLIMREPGIQLAGRVLRWAPLAFGCAIAVAGLSAALEARYRIVNAPGTPATPPDPAR